MAISNLAPASQAVDFAALERRVTALVETADRWATERPVLLDAEMAGRCSDYIDQVNGELKVVEMERRIQKRPLEDAAKAVDLRFRPLAALLEKIKAMLGPRQTAWLQAEQQRLAAERQAAEQQARQAAQEARRGLPRPDMAPGRAARPGGLTADEYGKRLQDGKLPGSKEIDAMTRTYLSS